MEIWNNVGVTYTSKFSTTTTKSHTKTQSSHFCEVQNRWFGKQFYNFYHHFVFSSKRLIIAGFKPTTCHFWWKAFAIAPRLDICMYVCIFYFPFKIRNLMGNILALQEITTDERNEKIKKHLRVTVLIWRWGIEDSDF